MAFLAPALLLFAALAQDSDPEQLKKEVDRLKAYNEVLLRQLNELNDKVSKLQGETTPKSALERLREEERAKAVQRSSLEAEALVRAQSSKGPAVQPAVPAPEIVKPEQQPRTPIDATVTAVANEIGLVVLSVGKDDRVQVGDDFTIYRKGELVAKVKIDRADRKWSAGKVTYRHGEPRIGDAVSNYIYLTAKVADPVPAPVTPSTARTEELRSIRKELDDVLAQVRLLSDRVIPSWQNEGLALEDLSEPIRSQLKIARGVMVRQVRDESPAAKFGFKPYDVIPDLNEEQVLRAMKEGKVTIYRQGSLATLQETRSR